VNTWKNPQQLCMMPPQGAVAHALPQPPFTRLCQLKALRPGKPPFGAAMTLTPVVLESDRVRLEPLGPEHLPGLQAEIEAGALHELFYTFVPAPDALAQFLADAQNAQAAGDTLAFAIRDTHSGQIAGSTRFMKTQLNHKRSEIGFTFLGPRWQNTGINTHAKYLLLQQAFDGWHLQRVEFLTDFLNQRSRQAILRLGAKEEGVLRQHMQMRDGRQRDSVVFSIIASEWPGVKRHLEEKMRLGNAAYAVKRG
jgi:N-acetyltransferase